MRTLLLSDVHANDVALAAVLEAAADRVVFLGDAVDLGPRPATTVERLRDCAETCVLGNHDRAVLDADPGNRGEKPLQWTKRRLSAGAIRTLEEWPTTRRIELDGRPVRLHHGNFAPPADHGLSPWESRLDPDREERVFATLAGRYPEPTVVHGHSHIPFVKTVADTTFVNPGSVGFPREGWRPDVARYAVWEDGDVSLERVEYDVAAIREAIRDTSLPEKRREEWLGLYRAGE